MKKLSRIFAVCFLLVGCTPDLVIKPDKLKDAVLGQSYYDEVIITGGPRPILDGSFDYTIKPDNSGIDLYLIDVDAPFNHIIVKGIPNTSQDITIHLLGEASIRDPLYSAKKLDKTYVIKVKEAE
ncbi:hypothetical protein [Entomomonas asaccharolytica]|uniref:Lipoprotein n=1 Tax=Entomomonas asaccharolytica TaxID=2785331 RepID=A0A974NDN2_9GAMM|nr:hypothetical protein [Entomomonas asaccharolytica]QQP84644.1 hypothetical protein JHT90_09505 [Entomomonas asaccharolytica]